MYLYFLDGRQFYLLFISIIYSFFLVIFKCNFNQLGSVNNQLILLLKRRKQTFQYNYTFQLWILNINSIEVITTIQK